MTENEWIPWEYRFPPPDEEVEWRRWEDGIPFVASWQSFTPEFNVAGLSWRPLSARLREAGLI